VGVLVDVLVAVGVFVGVGVMVDVLVAVGVFVGVGVDVALPAKLTISCGALAPLSRLPKVIPLVLVVVKPKLKVPSPVTQGLTSMLTHVPDVIGPEEFNVAPIAGALL
jgi:hypothetical protein